MDTNNKYINKIIEKIDALEDAELKEMIYQLIEERHNLIKTIKLDPLTGTYNRRVLDDIENFSALAMCDIDDFKIINDNYGHEIGDEFIKIVAAILMKCINEDDIVCRYGGDEFLIIFKDSDTQEVISIKKQIKSTIKDEISLSNHHITLSVGIAYKMPQTSLRTLIQKADDAMYKSKNHGKNIITIFNDINTKTK